MMSSLSSSLAMVKPTTVAKKTTATKTKTTFGFHRSSFRRSSSSFTSFLNSNINNKKKNFKVKTTKSIVTGPSNSISNNSNNNSNSSSKSNGRIDGVDGGKTRRRRSKKNEKNKLEAVILPDVDLVVRTSGTNRLSDFMTTRLENALIVFVDALWPDFGVFDFFFAFVKPDGTCLVHVKQFCKVFSFSLGGNCAQRVNVYGLTFGFAIDVFYCSLVICSRSNLWG